MLIVEIAPERFEEYISSYSEGMTLACVQYGKSPDIIAGVPNLTHASMEDIILDDEPTEFEKCGEGICRLGNSMFKLGQSKMYIFLDKWDEVYLHLEAGFFTYAAGAKFNTSLTHMDFKINNREGLKLLLKGSLLDAACTVNILD